jgi:tryptophanyl-tRNA synthetase
MNLEKQTIVLTGDRPTGPLHLGHYFGSLVSRKELSEQNQTFIMSADVQALTDNWDNPDKITSNVYEVLLDNLALGMNPENVCFYIQSQIPAIAELTVFFSNLVTISRLQRNPTVKSEISQKSAIFGERAESLTFGFLGYPISQAADILSMRSTLVPVGGDQLPMIEQTREIAQKFNRIYGEVFGFPKEVLSEGKRIMGLDGNAKMSKSLNNAIYLSDTAEVTLQKIKKAKTDSIVGISFDPINRPEISNLVELYALCSDKKVDEIVGELGNLGTGEFKQKLGDKVNDHFVGFRARRLELSQNKDYLREVFEKGNKQANLRAQETMELVRKAMRIEY